MEFVIREVLTGKVMPLGQTGVPSGIDKHPSDQPIPLLVTGLAGDEQGDTRHHGGPEKAVHHYSFDHYRYWTAYLPSNALFNKPGAFGENISTLGLTEDRVCIGDIYRIGTAVVQVSQGRQPCWRLNERFGSPIMARKVQESGYTGWYYRVLEEGEIGAGDRLRLLEQPLPEWPISRLTTVLYQAMLDKEELTHMACLPHLSPSWRQLAEKRLTTDRVEDWTRRLDTPRG